MPAVEPSSTKQTETERTRRKSSLVPPLRSRGVLPRQKPLPAPDVSAVEMSRVHLQEALVPAAEIPPGGRTLRAELHQLPAGEWFYRGRILSVVEQLDEAQGDVERDSSRN
jgi:hypothetical protein